VASAENVGVDVMDGLTAIYARVENETMTVGGLIGRDARSN
jgi:hypothetical protein